MSRQRRKRKSPTFKSKEQSGILRVMAALNMTFTLGNLLNSSNIWFVCFYFLLAYSQPVEKMVIVSGEQHRDSAVHIHGSILSHATHHLLMTEVTQHVNTGFFPVTRLLIKGNFISCLLLPFQSLCLLFIFLALLHRLAHPIQC